MVKEWKIVVGANYGDEGKGLATRYFTLKALREGRKVLNVLYNGGCQRGHTVDFPIGTRHVFHHFGSGTLDGADTYFAHQFILNPLEFVREGMELKELLGRFPKCLASPYCLVSTPYDMFINRIVEDWRGRARHGSCGYGIWETICRAKEMLDSGELKEPLISVMAGMSDSELMDMMFWIAHTYVPETLLWYGVDRIPDQYRELINSYTLARNFVTDFRMMQNLCGEVTEYSQYDTYIYEGGQGLALSENCLSEYPNVTPSDTGAKCALQDIRFRNTKLDLRGEDIEICYVTRPYYTRHGAGMLLGERKPETFIPKWSEDETNVPNPYQGKLRYAPLNGEMWKRIRRDFVANNTDVAARASLFVTHMQECNDQSFHIISEENYEKHFSWTKYAEDMLDDEDEE